MGEGMDYNWAFNATELSDVKVVFSTASSPQKADGEGDGGHVRKKQHVDDGEDGRSFLANGLILACASPVFKARLLNWDGGRDAEGRKVLVERVEEGELPAAEQLLRFVYARQLPEAPKPTLQGGFGDTVQATDLSEARQEVQRSACSGSPPCTLYLVTP